MDSRIIFIPNIMLQFSIEENTTYLRLPIHQAGKLW